MADDAVSCDLPPRKEDIKRRTARRTNSFGLRKFRSRSLSHSGLNAPLKVGKHKAHRHTTKPSHHTKRRSQSFGGHTSHSAGASHRVNQAASDGHEHEHGGKVEEGDALDSGGDEKGNSHEANNAHEAAKDGGDGEVAGGDGDSGDDGLGDAGSGDAGFGDDGSGDSGDDSGDGSGSGSSDDSGSGSASADRNSSGRGSMALRRGRNRKPRHARLPTDVKAATFWIRRDHKYQSYKLWRAPKPRQVWDAHGNNTAPPHRPATNMDLIMDLTMVVILARLGVQFRAGLTSVDSESRYDWEPCVDAMQGAVLSFFSGFVLLYSRWNRIVGFDNFWGQRDGLFELYWIINIGLFAIAGFTMVTAGQAPCYFALNVFVHAVVGLDVVTFLMYIYVTLYDGATSRRWNKLKAYLLMTLIIQGLPFVLMCYAAYDLSPCNEAFCETDHVIVGNIFFLTAACWELAMTCFGTGIVVACRRCPGENCCRKHFATNQSMHVGNYVERYNLLTILCIGECVVALTSLQIRETSHFDDLWAATPVAACGDSIAEAYDDPSCYATMCNGTVGVYAPLEQDSLFEYPEAQAAANLLLWMVFFRISLFEFNELDRSKLHALRRHYWSALLWRFLQPFITACILVVGYVMELVIAGHSPEGITVPSMLAFGLGLFILLVELSKLCHEPIENPLYPPWLQSVLMLVCGAMVLVGPLIFPAPVVEASDDHHRMLEAASNDTSSYYTAYTYNYNYAYSARTEDSSAAMSVVNQGLLAYFSALFFISVVLQYLYRREYEKLICCGRRCSQDPDLASHEEFDMAIIDNIDEKDVELTEVTTEKSENC